MKRFTLASFFLLGLAVTSFGQQVTWRKELVGWRRWPDGIVRPVYQVRQAPSIPNRGIGRRSGWMPATPLRQAGRVVGKLTLEALKRKAEMTEQAYHEAQNARQRHSTALRREWEANRRAAYAEWVNPHGAEARGLRQAATQASMERARAEAAARLRHQEFTRHFYGRGVSTVPTRQQWVRTSPVYNRAAPNTQTGRAEHVGGAADRADRWERSPAPERPSRARAGSPSTSDWVAPRPDRRMFDPRPVSGPGWDLVAPRLDRVDRRMLDPRPISGGKTYGEFTKERRTHSDTFTKSGNGGAKATRSGGGANASRSNREGGRTESGPRDSAPTRDAPARETRSYRDDQLERDLHRP
jgi:hypothetical protein